MSGSYGALNQKYNTLYSLYLKLQQDISGGYTLQEVLDAGNTANDKSIQLISNDERFEGNYTSTEINYVDNLNPTNITTLTNGGLSFTNGTTTIQNTLNGYSSVNTSTGEVYSLASNGLIVAGASGQQNLFNGDVGFIQIQQPDTKYLSLSPNYININGNSGSEGQVLSKDITTNLPIWADLPVSSIPDLSGVLNAGAIASKSIDMNGFDISGVSTIITAPLGTDMSGQFTFNIPPHIPTPILGNDATPKGYVDGLVGQYAGGYNLFFNYSQPYPYPSFQKLSPLISTSTGEIVPTTLTNGNNLIAKFMSNSLGIETIPIGLWDAFIYGAIDNISADTHYYFELWKKDVLDVDTLLGTSGISPDVNASPNNNPTSYSMVLAISTEIPLELTDRLYIIIYASYNGSGTKQLSTYFEGNYYSFVQTSLNAGTTLLSSNNTWTGTNDFLLPPTTPNQVGTPANTDIVNYGTIDTLISDSLIPIVSTLDYYITTDSPFFQYPPSPPTNALLQAYQYYGWYFINSVALRKIDWFFAPDYAMTIADVKGLYLNYLNITTTSNDNLPFITIYTKPTGVDDYYPLFAHSSATYVANFTPTSATPYCSFMNISGTQPNPFPYGHQLGSMILSPVAPNPRGEYLPTEEVLAISIGTNSTSPVNQVNFIMSKVGICLEQGNQELILNPQNIISPASTWVSTATSNLNMSSFSIDASANNLSLGTLTSTGVVLGKSGNTTNIQGNLQIAGSAGDSGQVLTSNGAGSVPTWTTSTSGWVGTATSNLNMSNYIITATSSLNLGETSKSVVINGAVNTPNALNYGSGANIVVAYGGETNDLYDTTTTNNIQTRITASGGIIEQVYNAIISPSASGTGALILPLVKTRHSVYIINGSAYNWTIASQTGEFIIGGLAGAGIPSSSSITIKPSQTLGFVQVDGGILGKFNIFMSEVLQGTSPSFSGATCPTIDTSSSLSLGTSTATGVSVGRTGQITDLLGNVRINSSSGSSGQVLTSTGASTAPTWQTPSAGSSSLAVVKTNPTLMTIAFASGAFKSAYNNNYLDITPPSLTATYLIQCQLLCNNNVANTAFFGNLGYKVGGGAQTTSAISLFNNLAFSNVANSTFSQQNSLSQCNLSVDNTFNQLSFTYIHTPATLSLVSYAFWLGSSIGNGAGTIFSMSIIRIIS